jgi:hypothetical protein
MGGPDKPKIIVPAAPQDFEAMWHYRLPANERRRIQCCLFWTQDSGDNNFARRLAAGADQILKDHGLKLHTCPGPPGTVQKVAERTLNWSGEITIYSGTDAVRDVVTELNEPVQRLRQLAHECHYHEGRVPVIFCRIKNAIAGVAILSYMNNSQPNWGPFILINSDTHPTASDATMLHEMGHCMGQTDNPQGPWFESKHRPPCHFMTQSDQIFMDVSHSSTLPSRGMMRLDVEVFAKKRRYVNEDNYPGGWPAVWSRYFSFSDSMPVHPATGGRACPAGCSECPGLRP